MLLVWASLYFFIVIRKDFEVLNSTEFKVWQIIAFTYPLIETVIKMMIEFNVIPYSWRWLNNMEHISWSICMYLILLPYTKRLFNIHKYYIALALIFAVVVAIGNFNELLQYIIRSYLGFSENFSMTYYSDSMGDLINNLIGGLIASCISYLILSKDFINKKQNTIPAQKK